MELTVERNTPSIENKVKGGEVFEHTLQTRRLFEDDS